MKSRPDGWRNGAKYERSPLWRRRWDGALRARLRRIPLTLSSGLAHPAAGAQKTALHFRGDCLFGGGGGMARSARGFAVPLRPCQVGPHIPQPGPKKQPPISGGTVFLAEAVGWRALRAASPNPFDPVKRARLSRSRSQKNSPHFRGAVFLAEAVGFEPTRAFTLPDFESGPL